MPDYCFDYDPTGSQGEKEKQLPDLEIKDTFTFTDRKIEKITCECYQTFHNLYDFGQHLKATHMQNYAHIEGQTYPLDDDTAKELREKFSEWPENGKIGERYWFINNLGEVCSDIIKETLCQCTKRKQANNVFPTPTAAQNEQKRRRARKKKFLPEKGQTYWTLSLLGTSPVIYEFTWHGDEGDWFRYLNGMTFETREACQEWYDEYKDVLFKESE